VSAFPELQVLRADHAPALLAFERANRAYFAASVPDRGDAFFVESGESGFAARHSALLAEQAAGTIAFHLLVTEDGEVLGRFNLIDLDPAYGSADNTASRSAELGYRLAEQATGRGLATRTVRELIALAADRYGIRTLRAETTLDNTASRAVLARTGFVPTGEATFEGRPGLTYVRHAPEA
jgi:ribosomal-protein-alanine N-acetyltransferase